MNLKSKVTPMDSTERRLFLVEDNRNLIELLSRYLGEEGFETEHTESAEEALEVLPTVQPDLILIDIVLPGMDGYELAEELEQNPKTASIPFLFMTGNTEISSIEKAFQHGGEDYIRKPILKPELLARVDNVLKSARYHRELERTLDERTRKLQRRNEKLRKKNDAIEELLDRFESREEESKSELYDRYSNLVEPHLTRLKQRSNGGDKELVKLLEEHLNELFRDEMMAFNQLRSKLTARQFEICSFVRKGLTSKEIASTLGLATETVKNHRKNIRKNLGLTNTDRSLADFLSSLSS